MSAKLVIDGKEYDLPTSFTLGEARTIKKVSGFVPVDMGAALKSGDPDAMAAIVWVILHRENPEVSWDEIDAIDITAFDVVGGEELGPPEVSPPAERNGSGDELRSEETLATGGAQ
jgi:hypothetical protein